MKVSTGLKVLLLDNETEHNHDFIQKVRVAGYDLDIASEGMQCLSMVESTDYFAVILVDNSVDMSAKEVLLLIRNSYPKSILPIIYVSTKTNKDKEDVLDIIINGGNDYMTGGIENPQILEKLGRY